MYETLLDLTNGRVVWPDPREALIQATKLVYMDELAAVAARVTKTRYPAVSIVPDPTTMKWHKNMVLKRNFSDTAEHVFHRHTENLHETISHLVNETNQKYRGLNIRGADIIPAWFTVPYIPQLLDVGEIRVFFIRGTILYMVFTRPSKEKPGYLEMEEVRYVTPVESLS
jgi:hypothetical protein